MDENEVQIDMGYVRRLWQMFSMKPEIQMCRNILRQFIFAKGVMVEGGDLKNAEDEWMQFCEDALDMALVMGLVVYRIVPTPAGRVPVVVPIDLVKLGMKIDSSGITFVVREEGNTSPNEELQDAHVFYDFGYNPFFNGKVKSVVACLVPDLHFTLSMQDAARSMELSRAAPPVMTETSDKTTKGSDDIEYGFYADVDVAEQAEEAKFQRTNAQMKALFDQQDLYRRWLGDDDVDAAPSGMYPLPAGHKYVNRQLPEGRSDFTQLRRSVQDIVFGAFGVPRTLIFADGTHRGDQEGTHKTFVHTVTWWKRTIGRLASEAYMIIGAKDLAKQVRDSKRKADEVGGNVSSKRYKTSARDIYEAKKKNSPHFMFPTAPSLRLDEVHGLYDRGVLQWKQYLETMKLMTDLPIDTSVPEPVKEEEEQGSPGAPDVGGEAKISNDGEVLEKGHKLNPNKDVSTLAQNKMAKEAADRAKKNKVK